jgi:hypothetical protein
MSSALGITKKGCGGRHPAPWSRLRDAVQVVAEEPGSMVTITWSATSTRVDARQDGELVGRASADGFHHARCEVGRDQLPVVAQPLGRQEARVTGPAVISRIVWPGCCRDKRSTSHSETGRNSSNTSLRWRSHAGATPSYVALTEPRGSDRHARLPALHRHTSHAGRGNRHNHPLHRCRSGPLSAVTPSHLRPTAGPWRRPPGVEPGRAR